ncbi:fucolectin-like [Gastrophryne carolinensis]
MFFLLIFTLLLMSARETSQNSICPTAGENVALRGRSTKSSVTLRDAYGDSIHAIDGNLDPMYFHGSCFSTEFQKSPWFRVDLLETYVISRVLITNRGDCCADYINGAKILIGDSLSNNGNNNQVCAKITSIPLGGTETYHCPNMKGRYVNVVLDDITQFLTFCEIQIFGVPANQQCCQADVT